MPETRANLDRGHWHAGRARRQARPLAGDDEPRRAAVCALRARDCRPQPGSGDGRELGRRPGAGGRVACRVLGRAHCRDARKRQRGDQGKAAKPGCEGPCHCCGKMRLRFPVPRTPLPVGGRAFAAQARRAERVWRPPRGSLVGLSALKGSSAPKRGNRSRVRSEATRGSSGARVERRGLVPRHEAAAT